MLKRILQELFAHFGFEIKRIEPANRAEMAGFGLYRYLRVDGSFDYEEYCRIQVGGNKNKIERVWVIEESIVFLANYIESVIGSVRFGICHGTRRGKEQEWFRKYLGCEVIGTEISDTAEQFPHTIRWDFHDTKPEWIDAADFIYSNAFDHSYDPEKCMNAWMSCVKRGGLCILEHSSEHEVRSRNSPVTKLDPFKADMAIMPYLITTWAKGRYVVREILAAPAKVEDFKSLNFIVIQKL